jgi:tricorn protease
LLTFVADNDIWLAPAAGGRAWRVTSDRAPVSAPRLSRDGTLLAWTSHRDGSPEVWLAEVDTGRARRLTYWGDDITRVAGWTADGQIIAVTATGQPFSRPPWAWLVPVDGGAPRRQPFGPVAELAMEPDATVLLAGTWGRDPAYWKRYRGGTAGRLWARSGEEAFRQVLAGLAGQFASPMLAGGRLAFLSDHEGTGNLYSCRLDGGELHRHTDHDGQYARQAATDGQRVAYQCAGEIYLLDGLAADATLLEIDLSPAAPPPVPRLITADGHLDDLCCDETGRASAIEVAGTVHWLTHSDGPARALSVSPAARARLPRVLGTTGQVVWVTDAGGQDALEVAPANGRHGGQPSHRRRSDGRRSDGRQSDGQPSDDQPSDSAPGSGQQGKNQQGDGQQSGEQPGTARPGSGQPRRIAAGQVGMVRELAAAPDGSTVAVAARDGRLHLVDVASGAARLLATSDDGPVTGLRFSPDSGWLAWSQPGPRPLSRIRLARLADSLVTDATAGRFNDFAPAFSSDGRYLAFLSQRSFDPVYDAHSFDLSFPLGCRPYLLMLAAATPSPFAPLTEGRPVGEEAADDEDPGHSPAPATENGAATAAGGPAGNSAAGNTAAEDKAAGGTRNGGSAAAGTPAGETAADAAAGDSAPEEARAGATGGDGAPGPAGKPGGEGEGPGTESERIQVDLDGLPGRLAAVPVPEARYSCLRAVAGGLVWLRTQLAGVLGESQGDPDDDPPRPCLERFDLGQRRCSELVSELDWFETSGDGDRLLVFDHGDLRVLPAGRPDGDTEPVRVDLSRARFLADPAARREHAFDEAGRMMRHDFWVPDMADVDWDEALDAYRPLLARIRTGDDFADLLWEVGGELGTSHAYVRAAPRDHGNGCPSVGQLGADLARAADGSWQITRVLPGESSDPRARAPLAAPGMAIAPGTRLLAVDGQPVDQAAGPGPLLAGGALKPVELTVAPPGGRPRRIAVVPLASDRRLRYQDWVTANRRTVRARSGGRAGYLHVPDMTGEGWAQFHRDLRSEMARDVLILDVRYNRGGHVSELVVEKLARRVIGWDMARGMRAETYPRDAPRGPVVAVANEFAGSDGDVIAAAIRTLGLGPVVGTRTWGGVIGIGEDFRLVDGSAITVPKYALHFGERGWGVENYGVDPDVEIVITPEDWAAGRDPQLATAIELGITALAQHPAVRPPDTATRPSRRRPPLPPRDSVPS